MNQHQMSDGRRLAASIADRLRAARLPLLALALVLLILVGMGRLEWGEAAIAAAVVAGAVLLSRRDSPSSRVVSPAEGSNTDRLSDDTAALFAEALSVPCLITDERTVLIHANARARTAYPGLAPGRPLSFSIRHPVLLSVLEQSRAEGIAKSAEMHVTIPNQTWAEVRAAPLGEPGADGGARRFIVTVRDLTEQKRLDMMRSDFIAYASHEMRTPLTSLIGFIETLQGPAARDTAAREKFLGIMRAQAQRLSKLVDDMLSLSRIEMRQHVLPTGQVNLTLLLGEVAEGLQTQASAAGVEIGLALSPLPVTVTGDRNELYEVFENIIDNAIKYGAAGKRVDVRLAPADRPGFAWAVTVTDHGEGIAAEHVPRLTERFYRVDAESSRSKKGTGLGLAIVKHIVNRHRGQLAVRSTPGEGTTVEILLAP